MPGIKGSKNTSTIMSNPPAATRPCTGYSMFFQLEREYILQTRLGYKPSISPKDIFNTTDQTYQGGPPLPSRYENLILQHDWHIPGKEKRRKRKHCKSHGKIGFKELNTQVSKAWSVAEIEIRDFCRVLSDIESRKYAKIPKRPEEKNVKQKRSTRKAPVTSIKSERKGEVNKRIFSFSGDYSDTVIPFQDREASSYTSTLKMNEDKTKRKPNKYQTSVTKDKGNGVSAPIDWAFASLENDFITDIPPPDENISSTHLIYGHLSHRATNTEVDSLYRINSRRNAFKEVDMGDDEIINIWKTIPMDDRAIPPDLPTTPQLCMELMNADKGNVVAEDEKMKCFGNAECEAFKGTVLTCSTKSTALPEDSANLPMCLTASQFCEGISNYTDNNISVHEEETRYRRVRSRPYSIILKP